MFGERKVDLHVTERAKVVLERWAKDSKLQAPILGISWGIVKGHQHYKWRLGFYERKDVSEGWLGIAPDFEFIVIQEWVFDKIDKKILDIDEEEWVTFIDEKGQLIFMDTTKGSPEKE